MPRPSDWQEEDLLALIRDQVEESLALEYKASPSLENTDIRKNEISKDVSSFANSAGGTIVYGITETEGVPQAVDGLDPSVRTKEWLESVIHGRIRPKVDVHINPISLTTQHPGRVAYVVSIPRSKTAHQASDQKYYKRYNFQSVAMLDHEIRDVMNRSTHPIVEPVFAFREHRANGVLELHIVLLNVGPMRARDIKIVIALPPDMFASTYSQFSTGKTRIDDQDYSSFSFQKTEVVIFPEDELSLTDSIGPIQSTGRVRNLDIYLSPHYYLHWKVYADDMPPRENRILLKDIKVSVI